MADKNQDGIFCKIIVEGVVQGVGFRPFVYRAASQLGLRGSVRNTGGAVEITAFGPENAIQLLEKTLRENPPAAARVECLSREETLPFAADSFHILESGGAQTAAFPSPDLPVCEDCIAEMRSENPRRKQHFFISCTNCGPRFSIMRKLPYDRARTSMERFDFCPDCADEYRNPHDRRFHAETVCCNECGPSLRYDRIGHSLENDKAFEAVVCDLREGKIVAVKGVGGFHLACRADDESAVSRLRLLKNREAKPLAVMFSCIENICDVCEVSQAEPELLRSISRPIVPVVVKNRGAFAPSVFGKSTRCGVFLPYTPLHLALLENTGPLVLTSANMSGGAMAFEDDQIGHLDKTAVDGRLTHDRKIVRPLEDSVIQISCGNRQVLRRGRGLVPSAASIRHRNSADFLAIGGDLKSAFCLVKNGNAYVSGQYGDLSDQGVYERFCDGIEDYSRILGVKPQFVLCDAHPGYLSTSLAHSFGVKVIPVQHHYAHALSVLAQHGVYEKAVAAVFDGMGYGDDGTIWGGEILICDGQGYDRFGHLTAVDLVGGDSAAKDAKKTAVCYLLAAGKNPETFDSRTRLIDSALRAQLGTFKYTGAGRLFDAVSAILGVCEGNRFEGECAIALQEYAESVNKYADAIPDILSANGRELDVLQLIRAAFEWSGDPCEFAFLFHAALASAISRCCETAAKAASTKTVALAGGVFQNQLLTRLVVRPLMARGLRVLVSRDFPPGDGGISLGQAYFGGLLNNSEI